MIKKILVFLLIAFSMLIAAAVVLPLIFKDDIIKLVKAEANNQVNAELDFGDISLSLFKNFPDFTLSIDDITVKNRAPFEGVTMAEIASVELSLDLMSVIKGEKIQINTVGLKSPRLHIIVLPDGTANYDIAKSDETTTTAADTIETSDTASTAFNVGIQSYFIRNANIIYDDRQGDMYVHLVDFTHEGSGDFTQDDFLLKTTTESESVTYKTGGIAYLSNVRLDMKFDMQMNLPNMRFQFVENYLRLNELELNFDGMIAMPDEEGGPIDLDLMFGTNQTTFAAILSLVPGVYTADFKDVKTAGSLSLSGSAKGRMIGEQLPAFALDLTVGDAMFQYPDLPSAAENISIDLHVKNPGGTEDMTIVDLNRFHVDIAGNPVDLVLHMKTPISDPYIDAALNVDLDLSSLSNVIPLEEGQALTGEVYSNLVMSGNQSALDQERYEDFKAQGQLVLKNIDYNDPSMPYATVIQQCTLNFSPSYAELSALNMNMAGSDIQLIGRVDNILGWYVGDQALSGRFNFSSSKMDLNPFLTEDDVNGESDQGASSENTSSESATAVAEVPAGFDFQLNTSIGELLYENLVIKNVRGAITLKDQKLSMRNLAMDMLGGSMTMAGHYETTNPIEPDIDFTMDIIGWDIPTTYEYLEIVQQIAPIMEQATGNFSTQVAIKGKLDQQMEPKYNTLDGGGLLQTRNVTVQGPVILKKIAEATKYSAVENLILNDTEVKYYFEDGRVKVDPTNFIIGKEVPSIFSGSHGFDMTLDYVLNMDIPSSVLGGAAKEVAAGLLAEVNKAIGANATVPERIKMDVLIGGTSSNPTIKPIMAGTQGDDVASGLQDAALDRLNAEKDALQKQAEAELDKAKEAANKAKADAEAKARAEADAAKAKAKAEADAAKQKAEAEAKRKAEEAKRKAEAEAKRKAEEEAKRNLNKLFK